MENIVIESGLSILWNSKEYFALVVNYLHKDIERDSWQMRGIMIGYILELAGMSAWDNWRSCFEYDQLL